MCRLLKYQIIKIRNTRANRFFDKIFYYPDLSQNSCLKTGFGSAQILIVQCAYVNLLSDPSLTAIPAGRE